MKAMDRIIASEVFVTSDEDLLGCPLYRRRWLLLKALETRPLREALSLAQAAEAFISQSRLPPPDDALPLRAWLSWRIH
jgi:hypothetical protein